MEFIFINLKNHFEWVSVFEVYLWLFVFAIVCLYFVTNLLCSPYRKQSRLLKKTANYLSVCVATKQTPNTGRIALPKTIAEQFDNYFRSDGRFPGEFIKSEKLPVKNHFRILVAIALSYSFALLATGVKYPFVPFVLFCMLCLSQYILNSLADIRQRHYSKLVAKMARLLDKLFGQSKIEEKPGRASDVCMDKEVDDVVEKINFFKANGINEDTAKEIASLLSNEKLNKIRTQEQQKKLNLALNGLLQMMSKKQQEKQAG